MRYLIIFFFLFSTVNYAATLTVGPGCTYANIQLAVNAAISGDIIKVRDITFTGSDATVNVIDKSLSISGGYGSGCSVTTGNKTTLDAAGQADSVFEITDTVGGMTSLIGGFVIKNGEDDYDYGGGIEILGQSNNPLSTIITYVDIINSESARGGGVYIKNAEVEFFGDVRIYSNSAIINGANTGNGGGIYCENSTISLRDADIGWAWGNTASNDGGGVYLDNCDLILDATAQNHIAYIRLNSAADGSGGGVYSTNTSRIDLHGYQASISGNNAKWGGGVSINANSALYGDNGKINNNTASLHGGGFKIDGAGSIFDMDRYNNYPCETKCSELSNNTSLYRGGAGSIGSNTIVNIESSWIEGNKAGDASIAFSNAGTLVLSNNMLLHNQAQGTAKQLILTIGVSASTTVQLCTIADTQLYNPSTSSLFDVTISSAATLTLDSNIIWDNNNNSLYSIDNSQVVFSEYNILQFNSVGSNSQIDPLFLNPGSDYHISSLSPAIGHANPNLNSVVYDIDAEDRYIDSDLDAGADEYFLIDVIFANSFE